MSGIVAFLILIVTPTHDVRIVYAKSYPACIMGAGFANRTYGTLGYHATCQLTRYQGDA